MMTSIWVAGKRYTTVENKFYNDGREISRLLVAWDDPLVKERGSYWKPLYLAKWPVDADPWADECVSLTRDPVRKCNISYLADYPMTEKTYEFDGKRWRLKVGWDYKYVTLKDTSYDCEQQKLEEEGYVPSMAEWELQRKRDRVKKRARELVVSFSQCRVVMTQKVEDRVISATFDIIRDGDPKSYHAWKKFLDHFYNTSLSPDDMIFLAGLMVADLEFCGSRPKMIQAFAEKGVSPEELEGFWCHHCPWSRWP